MAKSSYCYQESALSKPDKYAELRVNIRNAFEDSWQRYGYRRLHVVLSTPQGYREWNLIFHFSEIN